MGNKASLIAPAPFPPSEERHPFAGCDRLRGHYKTIGGALLQLEEVGALSLVQRALQVEKRFRESVAFVPVEVLESFFDDLLDPDIEDARLSIAVGSLAQRLSSNIVGVFGLLGAVLTGLYLVTLGMPLLLSFLLAISLAVPFATILYLSASGPTRRLRFAQVLSREISRRRGSADRPGMLTGATLRLREFLNPNPAQPAA